MEDSSRKIGHRRFATKKIRHTAGETYNSTPRPQPPRPQLPDSDPPDPNSLRPPDPTPRPQPPDPNPRPQTSRPQTPDPILFPDFNPPNSNLPTQPPDPNLSPLCGESSTSALLQTFVRRLRSNSRSHSHVSPVVWRIFHVSNPLATA